MAEPWRSRIFSLFEGVTIALDSLRANKVRAALTILGVAVGVFVVVVISAAIHGINASVANDFEKAGPTTFFAEPVSDHVRGVRRNGRHLQVAAQPAVSRLPTPRRLARCPPSAPPARSMGLGREVRYKDHGSDQHAGHRLDGELDDHRPRRRSVSRPELHRRRGSERRARRHRERRDGDALVRRLRSARQGDLDRQRRRSGDRRLPLRGELSHRRQPAARDRAVRDGLSRRCTRRINDVRICGHAARGCDARRGDRTTSSP